MKIRLKQQNRNFWLLVLFASFLLMSCGARKVEKKRSEESLKTEMTDNSTFAKSETKVENTDTNTKKTVETIVNDRDQTVTVKEIIEPVDRTKPVLYKDKNGSLQELNNAKKTTETTIKSNNTNTAKKESLVASDKKVSQSNKNESGQNDIKINLDSKKEAENISIDRVAWSAWNLAWLLVLVPVYLLWKNKTKIAGWVSGLWWV